MADVFPFRSKLKCDRVFPCSCCRKRGVGTICPDGELKGGKGKRLILADTVELHARISTLEQALHDAHCQATGSTAPHPLLASSFHFEPLDVSIASFSSIKGQLTFLLRVPVRRLRPSPSSHRRSKLDAVSSSRSYRRYASRYCPEVELRILDNVGRAWSHSFLRTSRK